MGSGVAFLDYDGDGKPGPAVRQLLPLARPRAARRAAPTLALYRNEGDGTFEDVTEQAGLDVTLYGMGVAVGDLRQRRPARRLRHRRRRHRLFRNDGRQAASRT